MTSQSSRKNETSPTRSSRPCQHAETPTREQVEEKAKQIAAIFGYTGDLRNIITEAMISVDTRMGAGVSLVDVAAKHDDQWVRKREDITWTYAAPMRTFF
jgi:hypothetical protein